MWDRKVDQTKTRRELTEIERMHARHKTVARRLLEATGVELEILLNCAERKLKRLERAEKYGEEQVELEVERPQNLGRALEYATKIERLASGEATERTEQTYDLSKLSIEELKSLRAIRKKLGEPITEDPDD